MTVGGFFTFLPCLQLHTMHSHKSGITFIIQLSESKQTHEVLKILNFSFIVLRNANAGL